MTATEQEEALCDQCYKNPTRDAAEENSGFCPVVCANCGACVGCDGSC